MPGLTDCEMRLRNSLDELNQSPLVHVYDSEPGRVREEIGDAQAMLANARAWYGVDLDETLGRCFIRFNKFACYWRIEDPNIELSGEFRIRHFLSTMENEPPEADRESEAEQLLYSQYRVLDDAPWGGAGDFVALRIQPDVASPELWYHDFQQNDLLLDLDYCAYLDALAITKGVLGWQYLFADVSLQDEELGTFKQDLTDAMTVLPDLFPEHDYGPLKERLRERIR
ncbi:hypothetical protein [Streptomyces sp. Da 82-17]|uniref:hypothetical protein n=1 Tax=Streptomyces sp. Da 82-17 TaxID=3377116 RepID=UPI0038D4162D